ANAGKTFLIFVQGTGGTSRNLSAAVTGAPAGCALGNEQGVQVTFTCNNNTPVVCPPGTPGCPPNPLDIPLVNGCDLQRAENGSFFLDVFGSNIKRDATVTIGGVAPKKVKFIELEPGSTTSFRTIRLIKKICGQLPGNIVVTNPGANGGSSSAFFCNKSCPTN
ncbi:MAG TPA: hypothetical protein VKA60_16695, partial [Blastocatellia bacterium]|nr:hypothetical protein [Blastocatellia bacterium]